MNNIYVVQVYIQMIGSMFIGFACAKDKEPIERTLGFLLVYTGIIAGWWVLVLSNLSA